MYVIIYKTGQKDIKNILQNKCSVIKLTKPREAQYKLTDKQKMERNQNQQIKKDKQKNKPILTATNSYFLFQYLLLKGKLIQLLHLHLFFYFQSQYFHPSLIALPTLFILHVYFTYSLLTCLLIIIISKYQPKLIITMQSIFRIYAKTSKPNDKYLYKQLLSYGLQPKYEDLLHSYYFNANFNQLFMLSFQAFTAQSLYVQLGHRYPLSTQVGENEKSVTEFLKKINFRSFIPLSRGIVQNTTLKLLIRQSSNHLPSENVMISLFQNYLQKQIIMKEYRKMAKNEQFSRLENYYDIKQIVEKKWQHEDAQKQEQNLRLQGTNSQNVKLIDGIGGRSVKRSQKSNEIVNNQQKQRQNQISNLFEVPYSPHFIMYVRRNHVRLLLKINKDSMHKHGWKKNVGWGPIRQSLAASILYRSGINEYAKQKGSITIWDPLCGSGTIPMVALTMIKNLRVRQNQISNFIWHKWPVYNPNYLQEYICKIQQKSKDVRVNIFCSDIDSSAVQNTVNNFKQLIAQNKSKICRSEQQQNFIKISPIDSIYQLVANKIYIGSGDFDNFPQKIAHSGKKVTIITNLPYLGQRSKEHHPIKQLVSIYKRFNNMINKFQQYIDNVFVVVDSDLQNSNHFIKVSSNSWTILEYLQNGGIQVCLLGWAKNSIGFKQIEIYQENQNKGATTYDSQKQSNLEQYRQQIKQVQDKYYKLPKHLGPKKGLRQTKRVNEKKRVRHLQAAYEIFAKRKDKNQIYQKFARKNLALRLSQRGKTWKRRNISLVGDINGKEELIKKQFENRIEEAIKRSEQMKLRRKENSEKTKRKW